MNNYDEWVKSIENHVGLSAKEIREKSPEEIKKFITNKTKKRISFKSAFPFIGRGNVLRDDLITSEEINNEIDKILA